VTDFSALGKHLRSQGELARAREAFLRAVKDAPTAPEPRHHLAGVLAGLGEYDAAEAQYRRALDLAPESGSTARALAELLLAGGDYAEGFALWEHRHDLADRARPPLPFPEWRGEPLAGRRLLIWPEQGFGDQIMFARFAPVLREMGAEVTLLCWPGLTRLFEASLGVRVQSASGAVEFPDPDFWVMTMSVAGRLGLTPETLPGAPYLRAPLAAPRPVGFRVGVMPSGGAEPIGRSLPADQAARLLALPAEMVDLSPQATGAKDFADTAAIVESLDLVISVDTSVAHLTGAMGKPCWTLLKDQPDWRWLRRRADSPWYPSMRLYRQPAAGDWASVVDQVASDLTTFRSGRP